MRGTWIAVSLAAMACIAAECAPRPPLMPTAPTVVAPVEPPKPPPPPACVPTPDEDSAITHASGSGSVIAYCVGGDPHACFSLDTASGALAHLDEPPPTPPPPAAAHVETPNGSVQVCRDAGECIALPIKVAENFAANRVAADTAGKLAAVLVGDEPAGRAHAEIWDVVTRRKLASFPYAHGDYRCGSAVFLAETLLVTARTCSGPSARGALYSAKGKKLADVGGAEFGVFGDARAQVTASAWAFLEENGERIAIQDVTTGKIIGAVDTAALWQRAGVPAAGAIGNPGESAMIAVGDKLAVIAGSPMDGSVAIVDTSTNQVVVTRPRLCSAAGEPPTADPAARPKPSSTGIPMPSAGEGLGSRD